MAEDPATHFVRTHLAFVWRVLRRLGLPPSDADDASQRVLLVALGRLAEIEPGHERAFLFRTACFIASRVHRGRKRRRELDEDELAQYVHPGPDAETLLVERHARARLDAILERMPRDLRVAFVLFEIEELSKEEVARALDIPPGTAASRLRRAREEFARRLRQKQLFDRPKGELG